MSYAATASAASVLSSYGYGVLRSHGARFGKPYRVWAPGASEVELMSLAQLNRLAKQLLEADA